MAIVASTPDLDGLDHAVRVLREWQDDAAPVQLHPGDLGFAWQHGAPATAAALRTWTDDGRVLAIGLLDGPTLLRLTTAPGTDRDEPLARQLAEDLDRPESGVLPRGEAAVEAPSGALVQDLLVERGWRVGEPWTPLRRDLATPVPDPGVRVEEVGPERAHEWVAVHRAAFDGSRATVERWQAIASGLPYDDALSLVAYDADGEPVAVVTVWSAGPGRPGLLEPVAVHRDHRGRGHGRAITLAAAAALRELGSSSAIVATPTANTGAVATYASAGFQPLDERYDRYRPA